MARGKELVRALVRRGTRTGKVRPAEGATGRLAEPAVCAGCGAVFARRTWRQGRSLTDALLARASWTICPACTQVRRAEYLGRVLIRGEGAMAMEEVVRRRIANVARRAGATQPERRIVSLERRGDTLEVLTTSQKLAHRIAHELCKQFGGRARYAWADDGSLLATWERPTIIRRAPRGRGPAAARRARP